MGEEATAAWSSVSNSSGEQAGIHKEWQMISLIKFNTQNNSKMMQYSWQTS